jgi:hypothetical protein
MRFPQIVQVIGAKSTFHELHWRSPSAYAGHKKGSEPFELLAGKISQVVLCGHGKNL